MKSVALIVAAGRGVRFGGEIPKQFRSIWNRPLLSWTIYQYERAVKIDEIVIVAPEDYLLYTNEKVVNPFAFKKVSHIVAGGESRIDSVWRGLKSLPYSTGLVAIHDGARPLVSPGDIDRVIESAQKNRAAILARPITDTIKRVEGDFIISTLDRAKLYQAETPQAFQYDLIMSAHERAGSELNATDDAYLVESLGFKVKTVIPEKINLKITTEEDLNLAKYLLKDDNASWN
ncbi:2-C-methyl-D-erythritol 4-phosphate cytidylyltransferase [Candidatus Zixiibacteriota bacterium]|nr:2-C-methyl-D-erythritol 4-phosphate cytidylyltransferase [candidate division Zixibacteria bacterium]